MYFPGELRKRGEVYSAFFMEKIMTYSQKLKDPRWQKKRLKVLERDEITCQCCYDSESTLVVHHLKYSGEPWEIEEKYLLTLCESCHEDWHSEYKENKVLLDSLLLYYHPEIYKTLANIIHKICNLTSVPLNVSLDDINSDKDNILTKIIKGMK